MTIFSALFDFCLQQKHHKNTYWVAYSGGMDSHVLICACAEMRDRYHVNLHAIHINHGLSAQSALWAKHCADVCAAFSIPYDAFVIEVIAEEGKSIEEIAREKRYALFAEVLGEGDVLLTAQHQDDQAETMLLQLFRGAGPKGLAAMPVIKPLGYGTQFRPFLNLPRATLQKFALERKLKWIEDESNHQKTFNRNYIRHDILPLLKNRWPAINHTLSRSAAHCAEAQGLLEEFAASIEKQACGSKPSTLSVTKLLKLSDEKQKLVLRYWISTQAYPLPDMKKLQSILINVLRARWDKMPCVAWQGTEVRRHRDDLYVMPALVPHDVTTVYRWQPNQPLSLRGIGVLEGKIKDRKAFPSITVAFRRGGETLHLPNRGPHKLKHLFQEWGIPPWERDRIPLLYIDNRLISVVGHWTDPAVNIQFKLTAGAGVEKILSPLPQAGEA